MLNVEDLVIVVYCLVDDLYREVLGLVTRPARSRGFSPALSDPEVITMVLVGEFLGMDKDKEIHHYFRQPSWQKYFPKLQRKSRNSNRVSPLSLVGPIVAAPLVRLICHRDPVLAHPFYPVTTTPFTPWMHFPPFFGTASRSRMVPFSTSLDFGRTSNHDSFNQ